MSHRGQAFSHRTPRRPWPLSDHSPQAGLPSHTLTEGRGQSASEEGKSVNCQLSWMNTCTYTIHFMNFRHGVGFPQKLSARQKAETNNHHERMRGNCCHFIPATVFSLPHTSQEHKSGGPEEGGGRLRGRRSLTVRSRAARAQLSPGNKPAGQHTASWTQPGPGLGAGPHPVPFRPLDSGQVTGLPRPRFCICETGTLVPWGTTLMG